MGFEESTAAQLARQTNVSVDIFDAALAQLVAAGVPPSAAAPTLRRLYGPSFTDVDGGDGRTAYFLFEAGYSIPWELARVSPEELERVDYLGSAPSRESSNTRTN